MSDGLYWENTCRLFQGLFEKPRMTEALLSKPYFRYLMDIFAQTTKVTGYAKGLYSEEELSRDFYDTKEKKILFLRKMKLLTEAMLGEEVQVSLSKIVAGLEPEKTNIFLQAIHKAATSGQDSAPFVEKVLEKLVGRTREQPVENQPDSSLRPIEGGERRGIVIPRREKPHQSQGVTGKDDVETIREIIQNLTQNLNPIRSSMDLIPDDIESMNKEMKLWRNNFVDSKAQREEEQGKTEELLQAHLNKLNELEELKRHQKSKIQTMKSNILQNEQRIQQLLLTNVAK
jgi:TRAF3-interacting protein 1